MKQVRKKDYAFFKTGNYDLFDVLKLHIAASSLYYTICSPDGAIVLGETDQYLLANVINRIGQILLIANDYSHSAFSYPPPTGHSCNNLCHPAGATVRRPSPAGGGRTGGPLFPVWCSKSPSGGPLLRQFTAL